MLWRLNDLIKSNKGYGPLVIIIALAIILIVEMIVISTAFQKEKVTHRYLLEASLISQSDKVETYIRSFQHATDLSFLQAIHDSGLGSIVLPYDYKTYSQKYNLSYLQIYNSQIPPVEIMKNKFRQKISWVSSCYLDDYYDAYQDFAESSGFDMTFSNVCLLNVKEFTDSKFSVGGTEDMVFHRYSTADDQMIDITRSFKPYSELETKFVSMIEVAENMVNSDILGRCVRNETHYCIHEEFSRDEANEKLNDLAGNLMSSTCAGVSNESCEAYSGSGLGAFTQCDNRKCDVDVSGYPVVDCKGTVSCSYYSNEASCNANGCIWNSGVKIELKIPEDADYKTTGPRAIVNVSIYEDNKNYTFYYSPDDKVGTGLIGVNFLAKVGVSGDNWDQVPVTSLAFYDCDVASGYSGLGIISPKPVKDDICKFFDVAPITCSPTNLNPFINNPCEDLTGTYEDVCTDSNTMYEYRCDSSKICKYEKINCADVSTSSECKYGACKPSDCIDNDAANPFPYFVSSSIDYNGGEYSSDDECSGNVLKEAVCKDGYPKVEYYDCPNGCDNGACVNDCCPSVDVNIHDVHGMLFSIDLAYTHSTGSKGNVTMHWDSSDAIYISGDATEVGVSGSYKYVVCADMESGSSCTLNMKAFTNTFVFFYRAWDSTRDQPCSSGYDYDRYPNTGECTNNCNPDDFKIIDCNAISTKIILTGEVCNQDTDCCAPIGSCESGKVAICSDGECVCGIGDTACPL